MDLPDVQALWPKLARALKQRGVVEPLAISAVTGEGVEVLLRRAASTLSGAAGGAGRGRTRSLAVVRPEDDMSFTIERDEDGAWRVRGPRIERIVAMTRWEYYDAVMRFQRILQALGITDALRRAGVQRGRAGAHRRAKSSSGARKMPCKVGILGGTFDPIHIGHLILAEEAWDQLGLSEVFVVPAGNPPHKQDRHLAPVEDRLQDDRSCHRRQPRLPRLAGGRGSSGAALHDRHRADLPGAAPAGLRALLPDGL